MMEPIPGIDFASDADVRIALCTARTFAKTDRMARLYAGEALRHTFPDMTQKQIGILLGFDESGGRSRIGNLIRHAKESTAWSEANLDLVLTALAQEEALAA